MRTEGGEELSLQDMDGMFTVLKISISRVPLAPGSITSVSRTSTA